MALIVGKNPFGNYLGEILRAEGLVAFKKIELTMLMREGDPLSFLNTFKLVLLAETRLLPDQQQLYVPTFPVVETSLRCVLIRPWLTSLAYPSISHDQRCRVNLNSLRSTRRAALV